MRWFRHHCGDVTVMMIRTCLSMAVITVHHMIVIDINHTKLARYTISLLCLAQKTWVNQEDKHLERSW